MRTALELVKSRADVNSANRLCGDCTACCVLPRISPTEDEFFPQGKPGYTKCKHLNTNEPGCSIYNDRPSLCRDYMCLWRYGIINGDERRRPDNLGIMFTMDEMNGRPVVEAWELWEGAASKESVQYLIKQISETLEVATRYYGVPCSMSNKYSVHMDTGRILSEHTAKNPKFVAQWCIEQVRTGTMGLPTDGSCMEDINMLLAGITVERHYSPKRG